MAANTAISWCDHTVNFWVGCDKVSPACDHCYAEAWAIRSGAPGLWAGDRRRTKTWRDPIKWNRRAVATGVRESVFSNSLADFFDNKIPTQWRNDAWDVIRVCDGLDWYLVTKRIQNVFKMLPADFGMMFEPGARYFENVVIIITVINQEEFDRDAPKLKALKLKFHWLRVGLSIEPMLGPINLGECGWLDWVICGGESGKEARLMKPAWARSLRDQCAAANVPFHFKQWGEFHFDGQAWADGMFSMAETPGVEPIGVRAGTARTGRILDNRVHDAGPRAMAG